MHITHPYNSFNIRQVQQNQNMQLKEKQSQEHTCDNTLPLGCSYPAIYFTGKINPQKLTPKHIDFPSTKERLIKEFDNILKNDVTETEMSKEELHLYCLTKSNEYMLGLTDKLYSYQSRVQYLISQGIKNQMMYNEANQLKREMLRIAKKLDHPEEFKPPQKKRNPQDAKTDFVLINRFKTAVMDDNYDFRQVYLDYYSGLNEVKTIRELKAKYPKIDIPRNPKDVVAKKIEGTLTRDFYEELDDISETGDKDAVKERITSKVQSILDEQLKKSTPEQKKEIERNILSHTVTVIRRRLRDMQENDSFSSVPYIRKEVKQIISDADKKLLTVNYNDFVLSVIREQYLGFKKPNDIVYKYNKGKSGQRVEHTIKVSELGNTEYKFQRTPNNIKLFLDRGDELKTAQRNYDFFTNEELADRLDFQADKIEGNETFLDTLINFRTCRFEGEDIDMIKAFLRKTDDVIDGKKSLNELVKDLEDNPMHPIGTRRLNELERQEQINQLKEEQKRYATLKHLQTTFDDNINLLYQNDLAYSAEICSDFRPRTLDKKENDIAEQISSIIERYKDPENPANILNKDRMATEITRWKKYYDYSNNDTNKELLEKATKFATDTKGQIDYDKAGQYIINYEAVMTYPQSFRYARNKDAAETIMQNLGSDKDKAVEYLCKYDDYLDLPDIDKSKISKILSIFDKKDPLDKTMLKSIIENEYVKTPTTEWAQMTENGSKKVLATITPNAKEGILEHYKYPKCLEFFDMFEYALPQFAAKRNSAGIKKIDKELYELKITGHDDRLLARNSNYIFDEFDVDGLH